MTDKPRCKTCRYWKRWGGSQDKGICYGVPPRAWKEYAFPETYEDDRCPLWMKEDGE